MATLKFGFSHSSFLSAVRSPYRNPALQKIYAALPVSKTPIQEEALQTFLKERELHGDFIAKVSNSIWWKKGTGIDLEGERTPGVRQEPEEATEDDVSGGFLKLTKTHEWVSGSSIPPVNKKLTAKERQDDSQRRMILNLLKYEALKKELMLLTVAVGVACSGYCLVTLSIQACISYAIGVTLSCLYLQLLCSHTDKLSKEAVPSIFLEKKVKKIGIRSEDLSNLLERIAKGSAFALSSPRLVILAAIYGLWALSNEVFDGFIDFQLVPAIFGFFAYKAAALVQIYRDNEDLRLIFPDTDEVPDDFSNKNL